MNFASSLLQIKCKTILLAEVLDFDWMLGYSSDGQVHTVKACKRLFYFSLSHFEFWSGKFHFPKSKDLHLFLLQSSFFWKHHLLFFVAFKKTAMSGIAEVFPNSSTLNCAAMLQ